MASSSKQPESRPESRPQSLSCRLSCIGGQAAAAMAITGLTLLALCSLLISADVFLRYVFTRPLDGIEDVVQIIGVFAIAACLPYCASKDSHISIKIMGHFFGERVSWAATVWGQLCALGFYVLACWKLFEYVAGLGNRSTAILEFPLSLSWWPAWVCVAMTIPIQTLTVLNLIGQGRD